MAEYASGNDRQADSERMRLRVVQGKGRKDRDVVLLGSVLAELQENC